MSRRKKDLKSMRLPASIVDVQKKPEDEMAANFFKSVEPTQEIVIMNTDNGFVPGTVHLKKGQNYKIFVVNVNDKEKNTSFVLDAFSEHHATYFGQQKSFSISPKADGIFSFQCPETAKQGRIIVFSDEMDMTRKPASKSR
ncbi:MAG: cupredoxin domain-containing protein [Pseudobdellovibrionaceae bacterium]